MRSPVPGWVNLGAPPYALSHERNARDRHLFRPHVPASEVSDYARRAEAAGSQELWLIEERGEEWLDNAPAEWWTCIGAIGDLDDAFAYVEAMADAGVSGISFFPADDLDIAHGQLETAGVIARQLAAGG